MLKPRAYQPGKGNATPSRGGKMLVVTKNKSSYDLSLGESIGPESTQRLIW